MGTGGLQPRLLYPARLLIKIEGQMKSFPGKRRLKEYTSTKPALQEMLRDCFKERKEKRKTEENRYGKMAMNNYLSIITLCVNGLNDPMKRHRIAEWIRKQEPHICCHKKPTSGQKPYTD